METLDRAIEEAPPWMLSILAWRGGDFGTFTIKPQSRENQIPPPGDWRICAFMAGRGWGKTRTAAEDVKAHGLLNPGARVAVAAPTYADARDICFEGESGLLNVLPQDSIKHWNRSIGELYLTNRSYYRIVAADVKRAGRGPQWTRLWGEEIAEWRYPETWHQLMLGLRLGRDPRAIATFTPKPVQLVRDIVYADDTLVVRGTTYDNRANLAENVFREIVSRYEGTSVGQQEIHGELFEEMPGALWRRALLESNRVPFTPANLERVVVAVDPQATTSDEGSETGIVVAGKAPVARHKEDGPKYAGYVIADLSAYYSPNEWAREAVNAYHTYGASAIVYETNQGGDMVRHTLRQKDPHVNLVAVRAKQGKATRAEPIASLDERGLVHHVGIFPELEDQMCSFTQDEQPLGSDRVDARVYALQNLLISGSWKEKALTGGFR
jgi:phage terminase large subunit-like protein